MVGETESNAMLRACTLAAQGLGATSPNPVVGAVVLSADGEVVGEGWHQQAGGPHAEVHALDAAGERARGGTLVVTLEPCTHVGRTPPCIEAVLLSGVTRVVVGTRDPVEGHGGGADQLRAAGIDVETDVEIAACERVNEAWLYAERVGEPFVTLKLAVTLDGRVAAEDGTSRWITSADSRADGHRLRSECDAVLVGSGTVLSDDPHLTARAPGGELMSRQPLRVVVDGRGRTPQRAKVLDDAAPTLIVTTVSGAENLDGVPHEIVAGEPGGGIHLGALKHLLYTRGVRHVLVEGGPMVSASFAGDSVGRVVAYIAPALMSGGRAALEGGRPAATIEHLHRYRLDEVVRIGPDVRITMRDEMRWAACSPA